jgi:1-acyl-sn-glycerol-3-phosphate acyltransferase
MKHEVSPIYSMCRSIGRFLTTAFLQLKVYGAANVPSSGGVLLVANHESYLDPVLVGVQVRRAVSYFAKSELFENRCFGGFLRSLHGFPVRMGAGDVGAVREAIHRLKEGNVLCIFPEGTRSPDGTLQPIAGGIALIIRRANVPVVPVIVDGAFEAWPRDQLLPRLHRCAVLFGKPMNLTHLRGEQIIATIDRVFHEMRADLETRMRDEREARQNV